MRALLRDYANGPGDLPSQFVAEEAAWPAPGGRTKRIYLRLDSALYARLKRHADRVSQGDVAVIVRVVIGEFCLGKRRLSLTTLAEEALQERTRRDVATGLRELPARRKQQLGLDKPLGSLGL